MGVVVSLYDTVCQPCGKRLYRNRKTAKAAAKQTPGRHMCAYRCPAVPGCWHLGHLPLDVVHGVGDKARYEAAVARRRRRAS